MRFFFLAILAAAVLGATAARASTYYVAKNGNDTRSCVTAKALSTPKLTIKSGLTCLIAGDTLSIRAGSYAEPLDSHNFHIPTGTSWANAPRIAAYAGEEVIWTHGTIDRVINLQDAYVKYVIFDGLTIDATGAENGVKLQNGVSYVRFVSCDIKNSIGQGVLITGGTLTHHNEILHCNIHHHGKDTHLDHGIYIAASDNLVEDCDVHHNMAYGVHIYDGSTHAAHRNIVRRVRSHHNGEVGILLSSGVNNIAYSNLSYFNGKIGLQVGFGASGAKAYNNTIYSNGDGVYVRDGSTSTLVSNNIIYANGINITDSGTSSVFTANILRDPHFVAPDVEDFNLKDTSVAIDGGVSLGQVPDDFISVTRPQGAKFDVGAYEYNAPVDATPAPPTNTKAISLP